LSSGEEPRARRNRLLHLLVDAFEDAFHRKRTNVGGLVQWVADLQILHTLYKASLKLVGNRFSDDEALGRDTRLTIVDGARFDSCGNSCIEIGAGHDDKGVTATKFKHGFFDPLT